MKKNSFPELSCQMEIFFLVRKATKNYRTPE
jgi:hypothetical protein